MESNHSESRQGFTLIEVLVVIAIIGVLIGLLVPAVQMGREVAIRAQCQHNMHMIGVACQSYHDMYGKFPSSLDERTCAEPAPWQWNNPLNQPDTAFMSSILWYSSWMTRILPFVDGDVIGNTIQNEYDRVCSPWGLPPYSGIQPPHVGLGREMIFYKCAADARTLINTEVSLVSGDVVPVAFTSYLGCNGTMCGAQDGMFFNRSFIKWSMVTDGQSNTILVGERPPSADLQFGWWYAGAGFQDPTVGQVGTGDVTLGVRETVYASDPAHEIGAVCPPSMVHFQQGSLNNPCDQVHFWSLHFGGANFLFVDGSVHFLTYDADSILPALATRAGGDSIDGAIDN